MPGNINLLLSSAPIAFAGASRKATPYHGASVSQNKRPGGSNSFEKHLDRDVVRKAPITDKRLSPKKIHKQKPEGPVVVEKAKKENKLEVSDENANLANLEGLFLQMTDEGEAIIVQEPVNAPVGDMPPPATEAEIPGWKTASLQQRGFLESGMEGPDKNGVLTGKETPDITSMPQDIVKGEGGTLLAHEEPLVNSQKSIEPLLHQGQNILPGGAENTTTPVVPDLPAVSIKQDAENTAPAPEDVSAETVKGSASLSPPLTDKNIPEEKTVAIIQRSLPEPDVKTGDGLVTVGKTADLTNVQAAPVVLPKEGEGNKADKDTGKGDLLAAVEDRKQSVVKRNHKGSAHNSAKDKGTAKTLSSYAPATGKSQNSLSVKAPFISEIGQAMTGGEARPGLPVPTQLSSGLLLIQEVGAGLAQNTTMASTGQIKPPITPVHPQMVTRQISMAIAKQVGNGQESFKISLRPAELGQVEIRMDFHGEGRMTATVIVENERTLHLLQRDQGTLEKALQNTGFDAGNNDLNFSLKQQQNSQEQAELPGNNPAQEGDDDYIPALSNDMASQQQMKMAYSDNLLDINI